ncbi:MAG: hypothetical protein DRI97_06325 [Bacteroidetes bacterium]|nr:MAG: hypothetical protein DRI97_06325 [Bacteroidota bacterium]RLD69723.1 MAG: hypothetical protein DRI98_09810 [Bacteroidota bacterium]RLD90860.1 MAG: hypothetical protein DRJ29_14915 [Bacteroidota bacterium]
MATQNSGIGSPEVKLGKRGKCTLHISNRSGSTLNLVIHGTEVNLVRAMTIRRKKKLHLIKGTYVVEIWLTSGRITINPVDIPHISIERITTRMDVSIRGRKIVADLINDRARLEIDRERSDGEPV